MPTYKRDARSFSQFQTYSRCSEQYRLQKVEKVPELMTAWAPMGTGFHTGVEEWELSGRSMTVEQAVEAAVAEYDRIIAEQREKAPEDHDWLTGGRTKPQVDIDRRRERIVQYVREYIEYSLEHEHEFRPDTLPDGSPAVEVPFDIVVNGVRIIGYIDLVLRWADGSLTIRDLKAGNKLPNDPLQLSVYGLGWFRLFGEIIEYGDFFMCKNTAPTESFYLLDYPEPVIGAWLEMMDRSEKEGVYLPSSGDACRVCTVKRSCSLMGGNGKVLMANMLPENMNYNEREV